MNNPLNVSHEEWKNRIDLSACYHLAHHFGWSDIIWNHITLKTSKDKNTFLINKFGLRYDEISASNFAGGNSVFIPSNFLGKIRIPLSDWFKIIILIFSKY